MNFRWFPLEEIFHGMIIGGSEERERRWSTCWGRGKGVSFLSVSHACLVLILFKLATGKNKYYKRKHPLVFYTELFELYFLKPKTANEVWKNNG